MAERAYDGSVRNLSVVTPAVDDAGIRVDARLDDAVWERAALLHAFTQFEPVEGVAASQRTEVLVLVDASAIYFGIRAYDDRPGQIRATMAERDGFDRSDDYVRLLLDASSSKSARGRRPIGQAEVDTTVVLVRARARRAGQGSLRMRAGSGRRCFSSAMYRRERSSRSRV